MAWHRTTYGRPMDSACEKHDGVDFVEPMYPRNPSLDEIEDEG